MAEFRVGCLLDESTDMEAYAAAENLCWAWMQWAMYCCEESGGHCWIMHGEHPYEGEPGDSPRAFLRCDVCGAGVEALTGMPDSEEFVYGEVDGIVIDGGEHDAPGEFEIPVRAKVRIEQYGPNMDMIHPEYDVFVDVEPAWDKGDNDA